MRIFLLVLIFTGVTCLVSFSETYVNESFTGSTADDWSFTSSAGAGASLTAGNGDTEGNGWLRLTEDQDNQASFVYYKNSLSTANGLEFTFDFVVWGSSTLADGFTLAIFDASVTPAAGGYGGSLGYAQRYTTPGLAGGIVGFGFDTFGNFSLANDGKEGGSLKTPNAIAIRGSQGATGTDGYEYITGTGSLDSFSTKNVTSRDDAVVHTVRITIPTTKQISIDWQVEGDEEWVSLIDDFQCSLDCPDEVMFGFTGGTGSVSSNQEIRNLSVTNVPEPSSVALMFAVSGVGFWIRRRFEL